MNYNFNICKKKKKKIGRILYNSKQNLYKPVRNEQFIADFESIEQIICKYLIIVIFWDL